jgi:multidrug efflux pump subunit AcrB
VRGGSKSLLISGVHEHDRGTQYLPIRTVNGAVVRTRDVAWVHDGYQPQTSYVSENGQASALLTVIKSGAASSSKSRMCHLRWRCPRGGFERRRLSN